MFFAKLYKINDRERGAGKKVRLVGEILSYSDKNKQKAC